MGTKGTKMLRIQPATARAIRMYAGVIQADTGRQLTDDETVQHILDTFAPELMQKARSITDDDVPAKPLGRKPKAKDD